MSQTPRVSSTPDAEELGTVRIGLLGCGTVGAELVRLLHDHREDIARRAGCRLEVSRVAVRDPARDRDVPLPPDAFTASPEDVVGDPDVELVCELMGGVEPARTLLLQALRAGKGVVTANKELLAGHGRELFDAADAARADLYFEAAVGGGIPLIRPLKESLSGERIRRLLGIVNGTTNFVLTRMDEDGMSLGDALARARELGYAEADPSSDVEGYDAAAKCAILASIAFNARVTANDVYREGIGSVTADDVIFARRLGYVVKLVAFAELEDEDVAVRVHPAMVPRTHPLAAVRDAHNAVFVEGDRIGELMFYGRGAGGRPTAIAVAGDLVSAARNRLAGARGPGCTCYEERAIRPMDRTEGQYYLLMEVEDRPGVLAQIATVTGEERISIKSVWQEGTGEAARIVLITHRAVEGPVQRTVARLRELPVVHEVLSVLRVEGEE